MMEKQIEVPKKILNFLTGIYYEYNEDKDSRKKKIFDRAFNMAYKDMATHTVAYHKDRVEYKDYIEGDSKRAASNRENVKVAIKNYIKSSFIKEENYSLTELFSINSKFDFDEWHKKLCKKIVDIDCDVEGLEAKDKMKSTVKISKLLGHIDENITCKVFTYGQAQKLVNMMIKYIYIYYKCEGWNDLDYLVPYFHVPIDSYVLMAFLGKDKYKEKSWSKFVDYEKNHMSCQREIEKFVKDKKVYPNAFLWELTEWPFGINL